MWSFFFFQAEDGIRDGTVTGVQTCALPISSWSWSLPRAANGADAGGHTIMRTRSEERREGKSVDLGGRRIIKKKKNQTKQKEEQAKIITEPTETQIVIHQVT